MRKLPMSASMLLLLACLPLLCAAHGPQDSPPPPVPADDTEGWNILLDAPQQPVAFSGLANFDKAGTGAGAMLYPGYAGAAGFLAAIVTHGMIEGSLRRKQHDKIQDAADQVLEPYRGVLSGFRQQELVLLALADKPFGDGKALADEPSSETGWRLKATPHFSMTPDQLALVLDNAIEIYGPSSAKPSYAGVIRVVSSPHQPTDMPLRWTSDAGNGLKHECANLFAESVETVLKAVRLPDADPATFKTVRYPEGGSVQIERAQPLFESCSRLVLRTLRGNLMSVPKQVDGSCAMAGSS